MYNYYSTHVKSTPDNSITCLVRGEPYLFESFLGNDFRISPDSFFQVNVKAAEVMCKEVSKLAKFSKSSTLIDLCCGVGNFFFFLILLFSSKGQTLLTYVLLYSKVLTVYRSGRM